MYYAVEILGIRDKVSASVTQVALPSVVRVQLLLLVVTRFLLFFLLHLGAFATAYLRMPTADMPRIAIAVRRNAATAGKSPTAFIVMHTLDSSGETNVDWLRLPVN